MLNSFHMPHLVFVLLCATLSLPQAAAAPFAWICLRMTSGSEYSEEDHIYEEVLPMTPWKSMMLYAMY